MLLLLVKNEQNHWMPALSFIRYPQIMPASTVKLTKAIDVGIYQHHDARISHNIVVQHEGEIGNGLSLMARQITLYNIFCFPHRI